MEMRSRENHFNREHTTTCLLMEMILRKGETKDVEEVIHCRVKSLEQKDLDLQEIMLHSKLCPKTVFNAFTIAGFNFGFQMVVRKKKTMAPEK